MEMWRLQRISNYGSSTPAMARTALQGRETLQWFNRPESETESALGVLSELGRHLLKCVEFRDQLAKEILAGRAEVESHGFRRAGDRTISLPGVSDLQSKAEAFLHSARLAIAETGNMAKPFYGVAHGHKYKAFSTWAEKQFGTTDDFTVIVQTWEPFVKHIGRMRNAVDHPFTEPGAPLRTVNFDITPDDGALHLVDPAWGLTGEALQPMLPDFDRIIENTIVLGENILARLFYKLRSTALVEIHEIPADQRDPSCPRRLIVGLAGHQMTD